MAVALLTLVDVDTDLQMWRSMMGGYQGLMNASDVLAADLRQGALLEYLDHDTSGPPHPASSIIPLGGSERGDHGRWRKIQAFTTHAAFSPVRAIRPRSTWATLPTVQ